MSLTPFYADDYATIFHADCRDIIAELEQVDLLLTDPPYGIGADKAQAGRANRRDGKALTASRDYGETDWDGEPPPRELIDELIGKARHSVVWGANHLGNLPAASCWLVWDKVNGSNGYADCELAWTNLPQAVRMISFRWHGMLQGRMGAAKEKRVHPTQKSTDVMRWAIGQAPADVVTVLDPFMGSGTTLRAAKDLGRRSIGVEIDERYCEVAARRLEQEVLPLESPT